MADTEENKIEDSTQTPKAEETATKEHEHKEHEHTAHAEKVHHAETKSEEHKAHAKHKKKAAKHHAKAESAEHKHAEKSSGFKVKKSHLIAAVVAVIVIALIAWGINDLRHMFTPVTPVSGDQVSLEFYVMSQCPYGVQVEDAIAPVLKKLNGSVNFSLNFIGSFDGTNFNSLHGQNEVLGNKVQLCAIKYNPDKYMDMVVCMNKNMQQIPTNWETCAADAKLNVEKIKSCYAGAEGDALLTASFDAAKARKAGGSPTIYLNGTQYSGGRGETAFLRAICEYVPEHPECLNLPPLPKVVMTVLNDKRCKDCDVTQFITQLKSMVPGLEVKEIDYSTTEGKKLYADTKVKVLPAMLFNNELTKSDGYQSLQRYLEQKGDLLSLKIGAQFDPTSEICDNKIDDTGDGLIDCKDPTCTGNLLCREEVKNDVTVFIMSDCPYGRKAIEALKGVIDNFGDKITYGVHYIANDNGDGTFSSLHGQYEVDEDIVQLCVKENSPKQWFDYMYCRSTKGVRGIDWKECAKETGVDTAKVQTCFDGKDGKALLTEDIKIAQSLGVSASPTWMANNKYMFSGIDSETVKQNLCQYNTGLAGCDAKLSTASATPAVPAGACG
jgi:glutaredoxin